MQDKIRVLIAKGGKDAHTTGAIVVTNALRDAGMEVVFTGIYLQAEEIVQAALQEGVDVIGLSQLDGNHMGSFPRVARLLKEKGMDNVLLIGGGVIPPDDIAELKRLGVKEIFSPGTPTEQIVEFIRSNVAR